MINSTPLNLKDITVQYPDGTVAVKSLSLGVMPGEIFCLVGPNGAGKSSMLNTIAGLIEPHLGRVICGDQDTTADPNLASNFVCLMPDPLGLYLDISAREYLEFFARAYQIPKHQHSSLIGRIAERLKLTPYLSQAVDTLSAGWQRRLSLGRILIKDAPIVLLDEPAAGLDVIARTDLLALIREFAQENRTVIVTSHIMSDLEKIGTRFGIIKEGMWAPIDGEKIFFGPRDLKNSAPGGRWRIACSDPKKALRILKKQAEAGPEGAIYLSAPNEAAAMKCLMQILKSGVTVSEFRLDTMDLLQITMNALGKGKST